MRLLGTGCFPSIRFRKCASGVFGSIESQEVNRSWAVVPQTRTQYDREMRGPCSHEYPQFCLPCVCGHACARQCACVWLCVRNSRHISRHSLGADAASGASAGSGAAAVTPLEPRARRKLREKGSLRTVPRAASAGIASRVLRRGAPPLAPARRFSPLKLQAAARPRPPFASAVLFGPPSGCRLSASANPAALRRAAAERPCSRNPRLCLDRA